MFQLPDSTIVNRVIPKNSFDNFSTSSQRKQMSEFIQRITWCNKLSTETTNLNSKNIVEIQIFLIELKEKKKIDNLISLIDKFIPYHILFVVKFENQYYNSISKKHPNPLNENVAVIDWVFKTDWTENMIIKFNLKKSIDFVFEDLCNQISNPKTERVDLDILVEFDRKNKQLEKEINTLNNAILSCKQFNKKVELNLKLIKLMDELKKINS
jgi:hypothetical protein